MLNPRIHAHCQASPAKAQTQALQRVCRPHRTTKTTSNLADEKTHQTDNTVFAKWLVKSLFDSLVQETRLVFLMNICAENPPLRKARNCKLLDKYIILVIRSRENSY